MPAYMHHHRIETETVAVICPGCIGILPMVVRDVAPDWGMAKVDVVFECSDCGAEVRQTMTRSQRWHDGDRVVHRH
jgi:hypothetical protein